MTFFSHINASKTAQTVHDQYWHSHIAAGTVTLMSAARRSDLAARQLEFLFCTKDTEQYGTFAYTVLLYLNTEAQDTRAGAMLTTDAARLADEWIARQHSR